jgi:quinol monooxygenase YgiN
MPVIVITRLRPKDAALTDEFFTDALAAIEQAQKSEGNLGADALADANNAWWSVTAWGERRQMHSYVGSEPHRTIMSHLDRFCDEATFVDWEQDSADLPDWQTGWPACAGASAGRRAGTRGRRGRSGGPASVPRSR